MKPTIPKGTRDFSPQEMVKRNFIFDTIKQTFQRFGYLPIETPAMENLETLMGKYGDEGDKLIFKILNSGNFFSEFKNDEHLLEEKNKGEKSFTKFISEKALRYDLTVPFARYVVQHQNEITFPFKRYQIQPVWRADRPQKGRYREFFQCDADVIGSNSLLNEVELIQMIDDVFTKLNIPVIIKLNNRKILQGIAEAIGAPDQMIDIAVAFDKLDKIGEDGVNEELKVKGFNENQIRSLNDFIDIVGHTILNLGTNIIHPELDFLLHGSNYRNNSSVEKGGNELMTIFKNINRLNLKKSILLFDGSLARGLNYYTGAIFEVKANAGTLSSSICGGGRYDDLTGIFGLPNMSGVGISFGADRIYDVMNELNLFPETIAASTQLLFVNFGEAEQNYCLPLLAKVRAAGINAEIYPDQTKIKKQFDYANKKQIPYVVVVGTEEMQTHLLTFKNMNSGEQTKITMDEIIQNLR